ncbi:hypothetical protein GQ457_12G013630 [Hibiscus cannabinus]
MAVSMKTQPRVSGITMNTWEWRENIRPVHEFEPQSADTWKEGPDHDWMMMIGGTFPVLPFQPPGMSIRNGLSTQNLRKAQECGGLMMGLDIYHGNIPQRSGSPWLKDRWLPGAQSGVLTFKGREGFTLMLYNLHGVYVNNGFGHIRKESTLIISGGPGSFCTRTVQLKKEIAERPRSHLERRRPLVTKQRSNTIPKESLELVKQKLRKHKAGDTQTMAEEVVGLMENLKFSEDELMDVNNNEEGMIEEVEGAEKWIVGKLISPSIVDSGLLIRVFFTVWKDTPLEDASPLGPNLFLFKFKKVEDREFVLNRCPWSFDGELLALKPFDGMLSPGEYNFYPLHIWARIYQIPLGLMSQQTGEQIGATMGVHKAVDLREGDGRMGEYLRVRTEIDSSKPLRRFVALGKLADGRLRMCPVKYERLPRFCFNCGRIGHGWEMCPDKQEGFKGPFQFGDWLKVDLGKNKLNARRKPGIVYAGQTLQTKPLEGEGERLIDSQEEEDPQQGKGKTISNTNTRLRPAKRSLKGKNEVCHPIAFKKSRTANSVGGVEEEGVETSSPNIQTEPTVEAVQALRQFSAVNGPDLVFLCEPRLYKNKTEQVSRQLGMVGGLEVEWSESCVGLMLLWQDTLQVTLRSYSHWHIDVMVDDGQFPFRFTGIYGSCYREKKKEVWELLDSLGQQQESPWLIGGDLNEILDRSEKEGGRRRPRVDMNEFRDALNRNGLWDIRPTVGWFTWQTGESARVFMKERLDRFAASISWLQKYGQCTINTEFTDKSDHYFLLLDTEGLCNRDRRRDDYFRFDTCWMDDDECEAKVREAWLEQSSSTLRKIKSVGSKLGPWQKAKRSSTFQKKKLLRDKIDRLMMEEISETNFEALKLAKQELKKVLDTEERYWRQRSRVQWLKAGDRNTAFFHARANGRRKKNMVKGITDKEGVWVEGTDKVIEAVETCITPDMNSKLCAGFTVEEVKRAFLQIHPNKSPGIDGLPASFFRKYWNICGHDLLTLCLDLLDGRSSWSDINRTIIVLIPKLDKPSLMKQFRPISLCTVVYKICAKAIVNRLKSIMPVCIADNQSAFVPGRLITDNFLVAHELIHYLNCAKNGPNKGAAIKLDMEKAYDRVEWHFLHDILSKMGFASGWIDIVMKCVTTVSYAIRVNGCISGTFRPTRGLRQGDPLSPYLFLFCTQGLSALLLKEQAQGKIVGVRASQRGPRVNHLLYADDCILFIKNSEREAQRLQEVLGIYEASSGQKVNVDKSSIFFSKGTSVASKARIQEILLMREELSMDNYLGLPLLVGKNKTDTLGFIPRRVDKRVLGWTKNLLSFGGRETLLKAVAQALPAYAMQVFLLPDCILDPIITTMRRYWWSGKAKERGWAHVAWKKLCTPKGEGGMGFRDLRLFNYALLGKQVWKLITCRDSLCFKVLSVKYFPSGNVLEAVPKDHSSFVWTSILRAKDKLKEGFHWRTGIDSSIAMRNQVWGGGDDPVRLETTYLDNPENPVQCKDFMVEGCCQWDTHKVIQVFTAEDGTKIIQCPIANSREDVLVWTHNRSGLYSTKSGHHWLANREQVYADETPIWKAVMKARTLPKIRIFGWRLGQEALPVGKKLQGPYPSCKSWLEDVMQVMNPSQFRCLLVLLWNIWNRRNKWVHQNQLIPARLVSDYAQMIAAESQEDENTLSQPLQNQRAERWKKPAVGTIKVNVDGAWSQERSLAAVGIVARDHNGMVVDAMAQRKEGPHTTSTIEACAFAEGVQMALQHGWPRVQIEGDAQQIVAQLKGTRLDRSVVASYLHETWASLQAQPDYMVSFINRSCNKVAHNLAHFMFTNAEPFYFSYDLPSCISDIVIDEAIFG